MQPIVCLIQREVDIYVAVGRGRELATALGFNTIDHTRIEIAILELTRNLLVHAGGGEMIIERVTDSKGLAGLAIETRDKGPGIPDIALALQDGYSTARTLGAGLPGTKRMMDEFQITSEVGVGTQVRAVKWVSKRREAHR